MQTTLNFLLVDDHPLQTDAYQAILDFVKEDWELTFQHAHSCQEVYEFATNHPMRDEIDFVLLDLSLPAYAEKNLFSGHDLACLINQQMPKAHIIFLTSHFEALLLYNLYHDFQPAGILVKSDFTGAQLEEHFTELLKGNKIYSPTFLEARAKVNDSDIFLDKLNRQIMLKLAEGYPSKDLPGFIGLSISAINKRKAKLKEYFEVENKQDNYIILQARKQGLI